MYFFFSRVVVMRQVSPVNLAVIFVVKLFLGNRSSK